MTIRPTCHVFEDDVRAVWADDGAHIGLHRSATGLVLVLLFCDRSSPAVRSVGTSAMFSHYFHYILWSDGGARSNKCCIPVVAGNGGTPACALQTVVGLQDHSRDTGSEGLRF